MISKYERYLAWLTSFFLFYDKVYLPGLGLVSPAFFSLKFKPHLSPLKSIVLFEAFRIKTRVAGIFLFESLNQVVEIPSSIRVSVMQARPIDLYRRTYFHLFFLFVAAIGAWLERRKAICYAVRYYKKEPNERGMLLEMRAVRSFNLVKWGN